MYRDFGKGCVLLLATMSVALSITAPFVTFNNGEKYPTLGLGTYESKHGDVTQAVKDAIDIGYRHFDCASAYNNEHEVGEALAAKIADGTVKREDVYITSKLWNTQLRPDLVEPAIRESLRKFGLEYLDLYLIHWPFALKEGDVQLPFNPDGTVAYSDVDYVDTWRAMEEVQKKGLTKSIGVSNFNATQISRVLQNCTIKPVVNQIEVHPYLNQQKLLDFLKTKNIIPTAYSPLGSPYRPEAQPQLLDDPIISGIAKKYNKTSAQVVLKYGVQRGCIVIPKTVTKSRLYENINIWDFDETQEEIELINTLNRNLRVTPFDVAKTHKNYPFSDGK